MNFPKGISKESINTVIIIIIIISISFSLEVYVLYGNFVVFQPLS